MHPVLLPLIAVDWTWEWIAYLLGNWSFVEVLEQLGSFSILVAVVFYFADSGRRVQMRHYQAWQVINTAAGKGGSGGRIEALHELNADKVPLIGVDVSGAFLRGLRLTRASLLRSNFSGADLRDSDFQNADLSDSDLHAANLRQSNLQNVTFSGSNLNDSDLENADLAGSDLSDTSLDNADLRYVQFRDVKWERLKSLQKANIYGVKNAPAGFIAWALDHGAVQSGETASAGSPD